MSVPVIIKQIRLTTAQIAASSDTYTVDQIIWNKTTNQYAFADGVTPISALTFYGGVSVSPTWGSITGTLSSQTDLQTALNGKQNTITTGTTSQYLRGDLSLATFPTLVSAFTNDSGYITSSALSPYLTIANAALTYQPIGSYLTGLTVGTTGITSGTSSRILYNNGGVLGEYSVTGTGTTAVLSTSPTISTSLTVTTTSTTNVIRDLVGTPTSSAIYLNQTTPSATNFAFGGSSTGVTIVNGSGTAGAINLRSLGSNIFILNGTATSGNSVAFNYTPLSITGQTASETSTSKWDGRGIQFTSGATIATQRSNYFRANTYTATSATQTITDLYNLYSETDTVSTNTAATYSWAAGFGGNVKLTASTTLLQVHATTSADFSNKLQFTNNTTGLASIDGTFMGLANSVDFYFNQQETNGRVFFKVNGSDRFVLASDGSVGIGGVNYNGNTMAGSQLAIRTVVTTGAVSGFEYRGVSNTGQTAGTNIPQVRFNGATTTWAAGTITNQYWNYFSANTAAFASPSTITNSYGLYVEAATAGTNATINNNWSLGTNGNLLCQGSLVSSSPSGGVGYFIGAGSTVTQITSRTTGVTINNVCGAITLVSAAGTTTWQSFTVTNSRVTATDVIIVNQGTGTNLYQIFVTNVAAGSFQITFATTGGTTTEQPVFNFSIIKAVTT